MTQCIILGCVIDMLHSDVYRDTYGIQEYKIHPELPPLYVLRNLTGGCLLATAPYMQECFFPEKFSSEIVA